MSAETLQEPQDPPEAQTRASPPETVRRVWTQPVKVERALSATTSGETVLEARSVLLRLGAEDVLFVRS